MFSIFLGTPHLFISLLADFYARLLRGPNLGPSLVPCSPSSLSALPSQGKTGGLARSRGFRARTMDTTRPPSKPSTLLARHVVRKRNFLGAFAKLRETDATRIQHTECGYIRLRKPRNKTRHVSRFLSFVHYGRSSVSRIQSPNRKSSASVGNRGSSKSTLSLELLSLIYIYISHIFLRILESERSIIFQGKSNCLRAHLYDSFFILQDFYIYIRNKINNCSMRWLDIYNQKSSKYIYTK